MRGKLLHLFVAALPWLLGCQLNTVQSNVSEPDSNLDQARAFLRYAGVPTIQQMSFATVYREDGSDSSWKYMTVVGGEIENQQLQDWDEWVLNDEALRGIGGIVDFLRKHENVTDWWQPELQFDFDMFAAGERHVLLHQKAIFVEYHLLGRKLENRNWRYVVMIRESPWGSRIDLDKPASFSSPFQPTP